MYTLFIYQSLSIEIFEGWLWYLQLFFFSLNRKSTCKQTQILTSQYYDMTEHFTVKELSFMVLTISNFTKMLT